MNDFTNYTVGGLRQMLRERGLLTEGNKSTLALRLKNAIELEEMSQSNAAEFLADVEISTERVDSHSVNEENANSIERGTEELTNESIQQELETVKRELDSTKRDKNLLQQELDSTKREKNLLQQELESVKRERDSTKRDIEFLRREFNIQEHDYRSMQRQDQSMSLSPEVQPSTSRVTSTSRNMPHELNRRNNYDRFEGSRYRTRWRNQPEYERDYRQGRRY